MGCQNRSIFDDKYYIETNKYMLLTIKLALSNVLKIKSNTVNILNPLTP